MGGGRPAAGRPDPAAPQPRAGRPAAGLPDLQGPGLKFSAKLFAEKPLPLGSGAAEVYSCKFRKQKYIFVKNKIKKYKNKKTAGRRIGCAVHGPKCIFAHVDSWQTGRGMVNHDS